MRASRRWRVTRASRYPFSCLAWLAVAAGIVNFGRWGNPFVFGASYTYWIQHHPNVIVAVRDYGVFSFDRIGIAVLYYATGIPYILKSVPTFAGFLRSAVMEAPPLHAASHQPSNRPPCRRRSLSPLVPAGSPTSQFGYVANCTDRPCFCRCPDPHLFHFHVAVSLRFRAIHDVGGVRRLSLPLLAVAGFSGTWRRRILVSAWDFVCWASWAATTSFSSTRCGASACRWVFALPSFPLHLSLTPPLSRDGGVSIVRAALSPNPR